VEEVVAEDAVAEAVARDSVAAVVGVPAWEEAVGDDLIWLAEVEGDQTSEVVAAAADRALVAAEARGQVCRTSIVPAAVDRRPSRVLVLVDRHHQSAVVASTAQVLLISRGPAEPIDLLGASIFRRTPEQLHH
jgi:hypothetical protein